MVDYEEIAKKYKLPSYDELDQDFDLGVIEESTYPLREIRKKMTEKLELLSDTFGQILQPNPDSIVDMHECKFFNESERSEIFVVYAELQQLLRRGTLCQLDESEKRDAEWIEQVNKSWKAIKKRSFPYLEKMKNTWKEMTSDKAELRYLG